MPTLYVYPKQGPPSTLPLDKDAITVGRSADNDVVLVDPFCSGRHAVIFRTPTGFGVRDNGSKNGTYVNGRRIGEPHELRRGDEILVGSARLIYDRPQMAAVEVMEIARSTTNINTAVPSQDMISRPPSAGRSTPLGEADVMTERRLLSVLGEVSQALLLHKPLQELMEHIMDLIVEHLPMDRGLIMLREGDPAELVPRVARVTDPQLQNRKIQVSRAVMCMAFDQHLSVLTSDAALDPRFQARDSIISAGIRSVMCVPLWTIKDVIGVIYADRIALREPFTEEDLRR